jgi:Arc/MetJ-type ribon-helix-helix transcriptional regulator
MNVHISPNHAKWLSDQVSAGTFASIDDAIAWAIEGAIRFADHELDWAGPLLDKADASLARGEGIPGDEFVALPERRLEALRFVGRFQEFCRASHATSCAAAARASSLEAWRRPER